MKSAFLSFGRVLPRGVQAGNLLLPVLAARGFGWWQRHFWLRLFVMLCAPKILLYISLYTFLAFTFQLGPVGILLLERPVNTSPSFSRCLEPVSPPLCLAHRK